MRLHYHFDDELFDYFLSDEQEKMYVTWYLSDSSDNAAVAAEMNARGLDIHNVKDVIKWGKTDYCFMYWAREMFQSRAYVTFKEVKAKLNDPFR